MVGLFVGRISREKGLFVLADALKRMPHPPKIWLAGDGSDFEEIRNVYQPLIKSGIVKMLGRRDDIPNLLSACDFFVFPSLHENFSNALLEAMHAERAVIATATGGNLELVLDGITGALIPVDDSYQLSQAISHFTANPEMCSKMGRNARTRVIQQYSLEHTVQKLSELYNSMLT